MAHNPSQPFITPLVLFSSHAIHEQRSISLRKELAYCPTFIFCLSCCLYSSGFSSWNNFPFYYFLSLSLVLCLFIFISSTMLLAKLICSVWFNYSVVGLDCERNRLDTRNWMSFLFYDVIYLFLPIDRQPSKIIST